MSLIQKTNTNTMGTKNEGDLLHNPNVEDHVEEAHLPDSSYIDSDERMCLREKKPRKPETCKVNVVLPWKNAGVAYVSRAGVQHEAKAMVTEHSCDNKCFEKITFDERAKLHDNIFVLTQIP